MVKVSNLQSGEPKQPKAAEKVVVGGIETTYVTDAAERRYGIRKLKPSERYALSEAVEAATMSASMQLITAASVVSIGDEAFTPIKDRKDLLAKLDEIGDEGLTAVTPVVLKLYGVDLDKAAIEQAKN